ncbi:hypothetical protein HD600_001577 [Microbacterium ginsengiterrae]|uniref:FHA domain-containing protein n=1 Tax=Microbacterium ginsengiterrae TaxID=546115 RepID=A0A7W9FBE2_9MICO|nr:FHA domain-containing protein [Microbacterium ginsengiterrae]MBB5743080.1 hypothetical protein [Microbacterium ginsengiterrae]
MQTTYRSGQWYVLVAPGALIALSPDAPTELVTRLWERERSAGELAAVIDALTEQASGSFAAMLPFAAVVMEGPDARVAVRGEAIVEVTGPDGHESFTGANVTTWSERFVADASRIAISTGASADEGDLPISGGIVRAATVTADIEPADIVPVADAVPDAHAADSGSEERNADASVAQTLAALRVPSGEPGLPAALDADAEAEQQAPEPVAEQQREPEVQPSEEESVADELVAEIADDGETVTDEPPQSEPSAEESTSSDIETERIPEVASTDDDVVDGATLVPSDVTYASDSDEFDQLFGATIVAPGPAAPPPAPPAPPAPPLTVDGDHDGATISLAEARALRQNVPTAAPDAPTAVLPVVGGSAGRVRVSTGQVVTLDRTVIIGRRPRSTRASGADLPHLIAVESPQQDISRSHLEIRPEGDTVVVVDLHTTNGSTLLRPGADPLRLHPGEPTLVLSGDVVDLGDGVTVVFEDLP